MNRFLLLLALLGVLPTGACRHDGAESAAAPQNTAAADTLSGESGRKANRWKNTACELVTDAEVQRIFGIDRARDALNTRTLRDQAFCLRTWKKTDWKEREANNEKPGAPYLEPNCTLVIQVLEYGTDQISQAQFDLVKRDRRNVFEEEVPRLGEGALWSNSSTTLLVKKSHQVLNITLDHADKQHDNLPKAVEVARAALKKM